MNDAEAVLEIASNRTPDEARAALIRAGILDADGNLTEKYRPRPDDIPIEDDDDRLWYDD